MGDTLKQREALQQGRASDFRDLLAENAALKKELSERHTQIARLHCIVASLKYETLILRGSMRKCDEEEADRMLEGLGSLI